jgi:hypothetical protein
MKQVKLNKFLQDLPTLPASVTLDTGKLKVYDQGSLGSSTALALGHLIEFETNKQQHDTETMDQPHY